MDVYRMVYVVMLRCPVACLSQYSGCMFLILCFWEATCRRRD